MKLPKGRGAIVLQLDYDGVLHHEDVWRRPRRGLYFGAKGVGHTLFENAALLEQLMAPYPDVFIVFRQAGCARSGTATLPANCLLPLKCV